MLQSFSRPTEVDALLYGHTYSIFSNPVDFQSLFVIFQRFPNLIIHCKRISLHYTFLRYIDFTKTDTDLELSRNSSIHNLLEETKATIFTRIWNHVTRKMCGPSCINNNVVASELEMDKDKVASNPDINTNICFKKSVMESCIKYNSPFEGDSAAMKSINYLGHKVIQQHIQQDLRNKLSDITIDTNSDLWSEKDLCYSISDRDLKRNSYGNVEISRPPNFLLNKGDMLFESDGDGDDNKHHLEIKSSCSGSGNSICCNTSEQLDWLHRSSQSSIDNPFSNKFNTDSYTENKNDTLDEQENIDDDDVVDDVDIDVDVDVDVNIENKSVCNASEIDWITDYTSDNELNNEIVITFKSMNNDSQVVVNKYSNCSIDHDSIKERQSIMEMTNHSIDLNREDFAYNLKNKLIKNANADAVCSLSERGSTISNTGAWTTIESFSEFNSVNTLAIDNNESVVSLMNDMINSVERMNILKKTQNKNKSNIEKQKPITKSGSETIIETYSDNHICDENCNITYAANDYSFWDDDFYSKSIQDGEKGLVPIEFAVDNQMLEEHSSDMKMSETTRMIEGKVIDKISNESLKKYFSCESRKQAILNHIENNDSRSSIIEEYSMERLSNVTVAVEQRYSENEFLKLLKSDSNQCELSTSTSNIRINSTHTLHNCDELTFEHSVHNSSISEIENSSPPKARVFRKCRRLLNNKSKEIPDANMHSDSKILQMYNEKLIEYRIKSNDDIENIRTACSMLKNFNTKPEPCAACSLGKFSSNPSISSSCKCCDSKFKFKSKSVNMFSSVPAASLDQLDNPH